VTPGVIFLGFGLAGMKERSSAIRKPDTEIPSKNTDSIKTSHEAHDLQFKGNKIVCPTFPFSLNNKLIQCFHNLLLADKLIWPKLINYCYLYA
jgi:hypothetical protein